MTANADPIRSTTGSSTHAVEPWRSFAEWAVRQLDAELIEAGDGYRVRQRAEEQAEAAATDESGRWSLGRLTRRRKPAAAEPAEPAGFDAATAAELVDQLLCRVNALEDRPTLMPADQPTTSHEIADRLFGAYRIEGGKVHLTGCRLEPVWFARRSAPLGEGGDLAIRHTFTDDDGEPLTPTLVATLGLNQPLVENRQPAAPRRAAADGRQPQPTGEAAAPVTSRVLVLRATGVVEATIGSQSVAVPFDGWARELAAPPAVCPETGREAFHLVALNDGRIAAAESSGVCEATGRRLLNTELRRCSVTGRLLSAELCEECPVTGEPVAAEEFATCPKCGQRVSRPTLGAKNCQGCRSPRPLRVDDERRATLLAAAPWLGEWRGLRIAETHRAWIVEASSWWRKRLVVVDRATGTAVHTATRPRFGGSWRAL